MCRYLSALISQSFLDIGSVSRILDSIMKLCLQFCWNIEHHESNPNALELEHITEVLLIMFASYLMCRSGFVNICKATSRQFCFTEQMMQDHLSSSNTHYQYGTKDRHTACIINFSMQHILQQ